MASDLTTWAEELIRTLQGHMDTERDALREYGVIAEQASDEHVRFLVRMILDDEVRHHGVFAEMVATLRAEIGQAEMPAMPAWRHSEDRDELLAKTHELLKLEREDVKELQQLRKHVAKVADTRWWSVIIDTMEMDNRKHIKLLEFIRDHA